MNLKLKQKIKKIAISFSLAVAMIFSINATTMFGAFNLIKNNFAGAIYSAENYHTYNFDTNSYFNNNTSGNSNNYDINRYQNLVDLKLDNGMYPISKFNGITTLSDERNKEDFDISANKNVDDYAAVISTNNYEVARKYYLSNSEGKNLFNTVTGKDKEVNVIYVSPIKKVNESDDSYKQRLEKLAASLTSLNESDKLGFKKYVVRDTLAKNHDNNDYTIIGTETDEYKELSTELEGLTIKDENNEDVAFNKADYNFYYKKQFEYRENYLYFRTTSTTSLTNNSYFVLSCWVYTAGNATASIAVSGTNLDAKIENISTNGLWTQYYLFIEARAAVSTSVYIYLYYGDQDGVTGVNSLKDYKDKDNAFVNTDGTTEDNYKNKTMTGTVIFDNLKLTTINVTDYTNQTINGHKPNDIAKAHLADGYTIDGSVVDGKPTKQIVNNVLATTKGEGENKVIEYTNVYYNSLSQLSEEYKYSARYYSETMFNNDLDNGFQNSSENSNLVKNIPVLDYDSYLNLSGNEMFTYYMPRYTSDSSTTDLTQLAKDAYRQKYNNNMLDVSIVPESEFGEYDREELDEFGNKIPVTDTDGNTSNKTEKVTNNTFVSAANQTNYVLKLNNKNSAYDLGVTSSSFTINPSTYYRVSVWAYSNTKDAVATAKLFSTIKTKDSLTYGSLVLSSQSVTEFEYNSNSTNGWKELVFFVQGNPYSSCTINLSLIASSNDTIYFDNIQIEAISSSSYSSGSYKLNLADKGVLTSNVSNGLFNTFTTSGEDITNTYPYTASNWSKDKENSDEVVAGIISTNNQLYNKRVPAYKDGKLYYYEDGETVAEDDKAFKDYAGKYLHTTTVAEMFGNQPRPTYSVYDKPMVEGNVYAMYFPKVEDAEDKPSFLIKSSNIGSSSSSSSLSANAVYKLTFMAWIGDNFSGKLIAKLLYNNEPLTDIVLNISDDSTIERQTWQTFTIYIRTGNTSRSSISLQLGGQGEGTLFFQNVHNISLTEKESGKVSVNDQFEKLLKDYSTPDKQNVITSGKSNILRLVDLQNNNLTHSTVKDKESFLYDSYSYTLADKDDKANYTQGTIGVAEDISGFVFNDQKITDIKNDNSISSTYLLLKNEKSTDYTSAVSAYNNSLSANKYYKLTFDVKTSDMGENGLNVSVNGLSENFKNINTSSITSNNGWSTYTVYVKVGSSSVSSLSLNFTLGKTENSFTGWALISNINLTELDEDEYDTDTNKDEIKNNPNTIIKNLYTESKTDDNNKDNKHSFSWSTFFLVFSSILLVIALVVALVAVIIKRKGKIKLGNNSGEKNDTSEGGIL